MVPAAFRASGIKDYGAAALHLEGAARRLGQRRVRARSDAADAHLRQRRLRRHAVQGPARRAVRHPDQQDVAQQRAAADQHQQHPQRRGAADQGARRPVARDRSAARAGRAGRARGVRRARPVADDRRARPAELQPLPRRVPRRRQRRQQRRAHARGVLHGLRRGQLRVRQARQPGDRRAPEERPAARVGQLRHSRTRLDSRSWCPGRSSPPTRSPSCASWT